MHEHELKSQIFHVCSTLRVGVTPEANTCAGVDSKSMLKCRLLLSNIVAIVDHFGAGRCFAWFFTRSIQHEPGTGSRDVKGKNHHQL
jgi:hypothetical protein